MKAIKYLAEKETIWESLDISKERVEDIEFRMKLILHDFFKPTKSEYLPPTDQILKLYISLAKNEQELIYCAYLAGMKTEEIFGEELAKEENVEDEY